MSATVYLPTITSTTNGHSNGHVSQAEHPALARDFVANIERTRWHDGALWFVRNKRDVQASSIPEWERLRTKASEIKNYAIANLADLLEQFEPMRSVGELSFIGPLMPKSTTNCFAPAARAEFGACHQK